MEDPQIPEQPPPETTPEFASCFTLQQIFNELLAGSKLKLAFSSRREYDNLRTMLVRKFSSYKKLLVDLDAPKFKVERFVSCKFEEKNGSLEGSFEIQETGKKLRVPMKFTVTQIKE